MGLLITTVKNSGQAEKITLLSSKQDETKHIRQYLEEETKEKLVKQKIEWNEQLDSSGNLQLR